MQHVKTIEPVIWRNHFSMNEISKKLQVRRKSIYSWLNKELIYKTITIFKQEFSAGFSDLSDRQRFLNNPLIFNQSKTPRLESVIYWRNKYITFVEKHNDEVLRNSPVNPTSYLNNLNNLSDVPNDPTH